MRIAVLGVVVLMACQTPYQRKGFRGGYSDSALGNERYAIDVQVNSYTSRGTALQYAHRRAGELCPMGYDTIDGSQGQTDHYVRNGNMVSNMPKANVALIIECRAPVRAMAPVVPPRPRPETTERRTVFGARPLFCTSVESDATAGSCYLEQEKCAAFRETNNSDVASTFKLSECVEMQHGACFNFTHVLSEEKGHACAPSISACETQLKAFAANPDYRVTAAKCGIYRVKAESPAPAPTP